MTYIIYDVFHFLVHIYYYGNLLRFKLAESRRRPGARQHGPCQVEMDSWRSELLRRDFEEKALLIGVQGCHSSTFLFAF